MSDVLPVVLVVVDRILIKGVRPLVENLDTG